MSTQCHADGSHPAELRGPFEQPPVRKCTCLYKSLAGCAFFDGLTYHDRCKGCQ